MATQAQRVRVPAYVVGIEMTACVVRFTRDALCTKNYGREQIAQPWSDLPKGYALTHRDNRDSIAGRMIQRGHLPCMRANIH